MGEEWRTSWASQTSTERQQVPVASTLSLGINSGFVINNLYARKIHFAWVCYAIITNKLFCIYSNSDSTVTQESKVWVIFSCELLFWDFPLCRFQFCFLEHECHAQLTDGCGRAIAWMSCTPDRRFWVWMSRTPDRRLWAWMSRTPDRRFWTCYSMNVTYTWQTVLGMNVTYTWMTVLDVL